MSQQWTEQIESLCARTGVAHIDVLVDHAGWGHSVLPAMGVIQPFVSWYSLFTDTPEQHLLEQAPILMRLHLEHSSHRAWLQELLLRLGDTPRMLLLISPLPFAALAARLRGLSRLEWGGRKGLLRYFDSRIFPSLLATVLDQEQKERFLAAGLFWGWVDRDHHLVWRHGTCSPSAPMEVATPPIVLSDSQFDLLGSIGDAQQLLTVAARRLPGLTAEQCFTRCHEWVLQAGRENYFGCLTLYLEKQLAETSVLQK